jgi:DNA-binding NarL/FixJ family response regulator
MSAGAKDAVWLLFSDELGEVFLRRILLSGQEISVSMKHDKEEEILKALQCVSTGEVYLCETAKSALEGGVPPIADAKDVLTASEKRILREIALGKMTKEIAYEKNLSFHTVNTHRKNIFRKLEINSVHEAVKYALQAGLVDLMEYYI